MVDQRTRALEFWALIKKEITGIQLLWETVNGLYFDTGSEAWAAMNEDAPLFFRLTLSAYIEALLTRISRLMDDPGSGAKKNLSLKRLKTLMSGSEDKTIDKILEKWDGSVLNVLRNKNLSHNDLTRIEFEPHTLNLPLSEEGIALLEKFVSALVELRAAINSDLKLGAYLDGGLRKRVECERKTIGRILESSRLFFELLPENAALQHAWHQAEVQGKIGSMSFGVERAAGRDSWHRCEGTGISGVGSAKAR